MKITRATVLIAAVAAISVASWAAAPQNTPGTQPARGARGRPPAVPATLEAAMSDMNRAYKALQTDAKDPAKLEQALKDLATMQRDTAISKTLVPPNVNRLTGEKKVEALESYRTMMVGLMKGLLDLEDAVVAKKADDIKKGFDQIDELMKQGHAEFAPQH